MDSRASNETIKISVVLATHNRASVLKKCLSALTSQTFPSDEFEVLIGDDGSADYTKSVVRSFLDNLQIFYSSAPKSSISAVRNRVLRHAKGEYILFIGDDIIASYNLLEKHYVTHQQCESQKTCVAGRTALIDQGATPLMYFLSHRVDENSQQLKIPFAYQDFRFAWTGNISVKRTALLKVGFFDEDFTGYGYEDIEYFYRLFKAGYRVYYNPLCIAAHDHVFSVTDEFIRWHQAHHNLILLCLKHRELLALLTGYSSFGQIEHEVVRELQAAKKNIMEMLSDFEKKAGRTVEKYESRALMVDDIEALYCKCARFFNNNGCLSALERLYHNWSRKNSALRISIVSSIHTSEKNDYICNLSFSLSQRNHEVTFLCIDGRADKITSGVESLMCVNLNFSDSSDAVPSGDVIVALDRKSAVFVSALPLSRGVKFFLIDAAEVHLDDRWKYAYFLPLYKLIKNTDDCNQIRERFKEDCHIFDENLTGEKLEALLLAVIDNLDKRRDSLSIPDLRIVNYQKLASIFNDSETSEGDDEPTDLLRKLRDKERTLQSIYDSDGWKALSLYYRFKGKLFPCGSPRWHFMRKIFLSVKRLFGYKDTSGFRSGEHG